MGSLVWFVLFALALAGCAEEASEVASGTVEKSDTTPAADAGGAGEVTTPTSSAADDADAASASTDPAAFGRQARLAWCVGERSCGITRALPECADTIVGERACSEDQATACKAAITDAKCALNHPPAGCEPCIAP